MVPWYTCIVHTGQKGKKKGGRAERRSGKMGKEGEGERATWVETKEQVWAMVRGERKRMTRECRERERETEAGTRGKAHPLRCIVSVSRLFAREGHRGFEGERRKGRSESERGLSVIGNLYFCRPYLFRALTPASSVHQGKSQQWVTPIVSIERFRDARLW